MLLVADDCVWLEHRFQVVGHVLGHFTAPCLGLHAGERHGQGGRCAGKVVSSVPSPFACGYSYLPWQLAHSAGKSHMVAQAQEGDREVSEGRRNTVFRLDIADLNNRSKSLERKILEAAEPLEKP